MGEYAEYQWQREMFRGMKDRPRQRKGRNPIAAHCPICGKGIRPIGDQIRESMAAHMKAKHKDHTND